MRIHFLSSFLMGVEIPPMGADDLLFRVYDNHFQADGEDGFSWDSRSFAGYLVLTPRQFNDDDELRKQLVEQEFTLEGEDYMFDYAGDERLDIQPTADINEYYGYGVMTMERFRG